MGKIIIKNAIKREPGFLYYINGSGDICQAKLSRSKKVLKKNDKKKVKKKISTKTKREVY